MRNQFPGVDDGHPKLVNPLLKINLLCELLSAVAIFFLVRLCCSGNHSRTTRSSLLSWLAASNIALRSAALPRPAWHGLSLPWFLMRTVGRNGTYGSCRFICLAAFAALKNRWFLCGCLLAVGAMFKGQLLFVAPFFVLWPLWQKRWTRALRVLAGFIATAALIASPWLLRTPVAWIALAAVTGASSLLLLKCTLPNRSAWISGITGCAAFVIGALHRRKLRLVASRFSVWQRALPIPCHQFVLQPCITSLSAWLVIEGSILVGSFWISGFSSHAAMDPAAALSWHAHSMRVRGRATGSRSRSSRPDCDHRSVAADVCATGTDA